MIPIADGQPIEGEQSLFRSWRSIAPLTHRQGLRNFLTSYTALEHVKQRGLVYEEMYEEDQRCVKESHRGLLAALEDGLALSLSGFEAALCAAAHHGLDSSVKMILDSGIDVNSTNCSLFSPLHESVAGAHKSTVAYLLSRGATLKLKDTHGQTPLDLAIRKGSLEMVKLLIAKGADTKECTPSPEELLLAAARYGQIKLAEGFLNDGADVDARDMQRRTPLYHAARTTHKEMVEILLDRGADIEAADINGSTALDVATLRNKKSTVQLLIRRGAKTNPAHFKLNDRRDISEEIIPLPRDSMERRRG